MKTYCRCGRMSIDAPDFATVTNVECDQCPRPKYRWAGMRWWERLDEWLHEHAPDGEKHPRLQTAWYVAQRPFCNWRDRRYGWPG